VLPPERSIFHTGVDDDFSPCSWRDGAGPALRPGAVARATRTPLTHFAREWTLAYGRAAAFAVSRQTPRGRFSDREASMAWGAVPISATFRVRFRLNRSPRRPRDGRSRGLRCFANQTSQRKPVVVDFRIGKAFFHTGDCRSSGIHDGVKVCLQQCLFPEIGTKPQPELVHGWRSNLYERLRHRHRPGQHSACARLRGRPERQENRILLIRNITSGASNDQKYRLLFALRPGITFEVKS